MNEPRPFSFRVRLLWWTLFAASFGYTEAVLVAYARVMLGFPHGLDYTEVWAARGSVFTPAAFAHEFQSRNLYTVELLREAATILLLIAPAMAAGRSWRERVGLFLYTFAFWDLTYYAYLIPLIGFPRSLMALDVYFLVPIVWYGPVWFPVLVVMPGLIGLSLWLLTRK